MKWRSFITISLMVPFVIACNDTDHIDENAQRDGNQSDPQPIHYESEGEKRERLGIDDQSIGERGGYPQTNRDDINRSENNNRYTDAFTNEESEEIAEHLRQRNDIRQVQVASTDDRVVVAVMLNKHHDHHVPDNIEEDIKEFVQDKKIVVYTDDIYWERMRNLDSRLNQANMGEDVEQEIEDLFNIDLD
ncbi:YhcN/YlaJ family sporulation lipoprotein [Oceanobacillus halotolerans]|uniref:YhcN/YlaJ family sporulation lipoprotein n=1 Tax=Oceanobacillus halotolerans TaxID=2663380 RepID=UPI0013DA06D8|nr:YhcN/YlaJ family sporulation lipoprotein [Oceanobacillus halotolerans]